ncbi:hypothetical protein [Streptomyces sp. NPDC051016]
MTHEDTCLVMEMVPFAKGTGTRATFFNDMFIKGPAKPCHPS